MIPYIWDEIAYVMAVSKDFGLMCEVEISLKKPNVGKVYEELPLSTPHLFKNFVSTSPTLGLSDPDIKWPSVRPFGPKVF